MACFTCCCWGTRISDVLIWYPLHGWSMGQACCNTKLCAQVKWDISIPSTPTIPAEDEAQKARTSQHALPAALTCISKCKNLRHKLWGSRESQECHEKDSSYRVLSLHCRKLWEGAPLGTSASLSKKWVLPTIQALLPCIWHDCYIWTHLEPNINHLWHAGCKGHCNCCFCPERDQCASLSCTQQCPKHEYWERNMKRTQVTFHQYVHPFGPCCRGSLWALCRVRSTSDLHLSSLPGAVLNLRYLPQVVFAHHISPDLYIYFRMRLIEPSLAYFSPLVVMGVKMICSGSFD